jgi:PAS domain S-box-containing protein
MIEAKAPQSQRTIIPSHPSAMVRCFGKLVRGRGGSAYSVNDSDSRAWIAWTVILTTSLLGVFAIAGGTWRALNRSHEDNTNTSAAMYTLLDTGSVLETEIGGTIRPAIKRTEILAKSPELIAALTSGDPAAQTALLNSKITAATEIDAIALFNSAGRITAINTSYANGQPISKERIARVMGANFSKRKIIQGCLNNNSVSSILEFQTHCDITPAFFDSTGLSVAYSVPVIDPKNGAKLGVISSRLRFERLSVLIKDRTISGGSASAYFITDVGGYFSEAINSGREQPPVPVTELREIVRPLLGDATLKQVTKHADKYLATFSLQGVQTLEGGGIHILIVADGSWLTQGPRQARLIQAAGAGIVGALLLIVAGLAHAGLTARRTRRTVEESNQVNARLAAIVESSTEAIISECLDGMIRSWNPGAEKIFGYSGEDVIGRGADVLEMAERPGEIAALRRDALEGKPIASLEMQCRHKDGRTIDVSISISLIRNPSGEVTGISRIVRDISSEKQVQRELYEAHGQLESAQSRLVDAARLAGMAEVATGVLHNVGNVLNSVNVSSALIAGTVKKMRVASLGKIAALLGEHEKDLGAFMSTDPRGKGMPGLIGQLAGHFGAEQETALKELGHLQKNIEHIKEIVSTQQAHAGSKGIIEELDLRETLEAALRIQTEALNRHEVVIVREFQDIPLVPADKHKVLQILVNLIANAKHAMKDSPEKTLTLGIQMTAESAARIWVRDTGCGIAPENMTRVFAHGFTTKTDGHGFGLHSSALAAKEMKGSLNLHSDGPGQGAIFTLELPVAAKLQRAA